MIRAIILLTLLLAGFAGVAHAAFDIQLPKDMPWFMRPFTDELQAWAKENPLEVAAAAASPSARGAIAEKWCPDMGAFDFAPVYLATAHVGKAVHFSTDCFGKVSATVDEAGGTLVFSVAASSSLLCNDLMYASTRYRNRYHLLNTAGTAATGSSALTLRATADEWAYINRYGIDIFVWPCGVSGSVISVTNTYALFNGDDLTAANARFLSKRKVWPAITPHNKTQLLDAKHIRSGDLLAVARMDGLGPLVMWGTGGTTGHSTIAVWQGDQLYVCESTDVNPFGGSYWPPPYGIIRHKYEDWVALAANANYMVDVVPLSEEMADAFDEDAFWEFFFSVQGQPYGYHTFVYCWLDTSPMQNLPQPLGDPLYNMFWPTLDRLLPNTTEGVSVESIFIQGLNHRLQSDCGDMDCVGKLLDERNLTMSAVTAIPENDAWRYGGNHSMTCSMFVGESWKAGFGKHFPRFTGTEQTPKDNYQMQMYSRDRFNEHNCPVGLIKLPGGNVCQLMGEFKLYLPGHNSVPLYDNMNEHCPSQWPSYKRCPEGDPTCC